MKKTVFFAALLVAAAFSSCSKHDNVETPDPIVVPDPQPLAIAFAEGNSLQFDVDETKIVHYTITGGSDNIAVNAELQNPDDTYTVETTPTSATEGTITITTQMPETENCVVVIVSDGLQIVTAKITVSTNPIPLPFAIAFSEDNSLLLNVNEPKTIDYTITSGSENTVVKAELQTPDDAYTVETASTSVMEGTITITAKKPSNENRIIVTVSDSDQSITAEFTVSTNPRPQGITITVETPGTLAELLADYDKSSITELTVIGNLNNSDISTLRNLPYLAVLDMEHANLEVLPDEAFSRNTSLTSVKLPKTLKTIGKSAFSGCSSLTSITIPDSVTSIGGGAFSNCSSLTSITIPDSVTTIGDYVFYDCSSLTSITIPDSVTTMGDYAFQYCSGLTSVTIGNSVTSIGRCAFSVCSSLTSVTIGNSVTSIEDDAFRECTSLTGVYITDIAKWCAIEFGNSYANPLCYAHNLYLNGELATELVIPDSVTTMGDYAFQYCSGLTSVTIGNSVTSIGRCAFSVCSSLTSLTIGSSVTEIGYYAFSGCSNLTGKLVIPDSVTEIGYYAFSGCSNLTSLTIGSNVTSIGLSVFYGCRGLTSVYCKATVPPRIGSNAFEDVSATLYVPIGCKKAYAAVYIWNYFKTIKEVEF